MKESQKIELQIKGVEVLDFMIKTPNTKILEGNAYQFEIKIEHTSQEDKDLLFVICMVKIHDKQKENLYCQIRTSCAYLIQGLHRFKDLESNKIKLPTNLMNMLNSSSVSTTRGVLHCNLKGTFLHNATLPMVQTAQKNV